MSKLSRVLYEAEQTAFTTLTELVRKEKITNGKELKVALNKISKGSFVTITDCKLALESITLERIIERSPTKKGARFSLDQIRENTVLLDKVGASGFANGKARNVSQTTLEEVDEK